MSFICSVLRSAEVLSTTAKGLPLYAVLEKTSTTAYGTVAAIVAESRSSCRMEDLETILLAVDSLNAVLLNYIESASNVCKLGLARVTARPLP